MASWVAAVDTVVEVDIAVAEIVDSLAVGIALAEVDTVLVGIAD